MQEDATTGVTVWRAGLDAHEIRRARRHRAPPAPQGTRTRPACAEASTASSARVTPARHTPVRRPHSRRAATARRPGAVQALLPDEATLQRHTAELAALDRERQQLTETLTNAQERLNTLPQRRTALAARREDARSTQETSRELTPTLNLVEKQLEAARRRDALDQQISAARKVLNQAEKDFEQAAKTYIDIRRRRTDGIVTELADRLVDGEDCPVRGPPTDTLSGGESFYVPLTPALGLADIVTAEAGGQALDTLFIDEGFGTLDEDTLHQVLDVLDSLRAHDRTVGLISHVPELRRRITQRLHISKNIDGSTLTHLTEAAE
ncbi:SbcC/MukB-like Walker B domain-containing protein [Streptomyces nigra]|uniref:SbcC/MukB-like Walker B domain-containing protein n=1 Tax=Streptomyces nigra TaxID=1827580 RepID=UPI0036AD185B